MKEVGNKYIPDLVRSYSTDMGVKFTAWEENYIKLAAEGLKTGEITKQLRTSVSTIRRRRIDNPNIDKAVDVIRRQAIDAVSDRRRKNVDVLYEKALRELSSLLKDKNVWVRMNAIRMIFERQDKITAIDKIEDNAMHVVFEGMTEPPRQVNNMIESTMADDG